jgi:hypothetical protein
MLLLEVCQRVCIYLKQHVGAGARGSVVVKALSYKPEGRGISSR